MNYNEFFSELREKKLELAFDNRDVTPTAHLSNEALFHLPLLAITILVLAKDRRKPKIDQIGQLVGECFERTFAGFKGSSQHLGWSANLRVRTVRALTFLESAFLIVLDDNRLRATERGSAIVTAALAAKVSDLSYTLRIIARVYRDISTERQIALGLE